MIFNFYRPVALARTLAKRLTILALCGLSGCFSPIALDYAVIEYDKATTDTLSKQLLLNIARSHQHQPLHFTGISNIAATFNFQFNAGATPAFTGETGSLLTPVFGGTVSENPTISIVPIEGEEFTRRLLTPFQENKLTMLLRQGVDVDLVLRLLSGELRVYSGEQSGIYLNKPADAGGYRLFRQAVLHLSSIQDRHKLFVEPLMFDQQWTLPAQSLTAEQMAGLQKEFKVEYRPERKEIILSKRVTGHILLTNYDPSTLSNEERIRLHEEADQGADNDVSVDIRPGYPGGEWPIHGVFRLRSFHNVLNFIGQSITDDPEYTVAQHPQTPIVSENPVYTMAMLVSDDEPPAADMSVKFGDWYYALKAETGYQWNREGFRLLCQIFQMTITDLAQQGAPAITIAK
ncbi:hypothetical protein [Candidatus Methylobacter oryzae]|uniref:Uncharacterized protein n=1 Tax=Candidatus Methylobacter oryzae TaxID=2497749 RepID=A0ABY3C9S9_9GAMM|nr:hypothetical protein [Candidatus Methylobacter oryzae]TRW94454.1 hypothetical protein EKO24_011940 [Candidatus Methylobacter oryzae]